MRNMMMGAGMLLAVGCGADLPEGWEDAEAIEGLTQSECTASAYDTTVKETLAATPERGAVHIDYGAGHFRCAQEVEGFVRIAGGKVGVLVQPVDMDPSAVAGCDCRYDIGMTIKGLSKGAVAVDLYRRWDNLNEPNDPVKIGSAEVEIP
ncbi:hypothetical protein SOCE836_063160 [Sorangium cellulosum]|uniref:Uncharacterized protein n=2 Tax=Polyangiaceae TaxID=49 RepID=A0A4P2QVF3_SORCE|nr:hypothetical protein SOCE836_063160 [Sorangium cellulosum]WCQ93459.1 hypothetical protein NQZ70_06208 [Sorangium sp. Soce836]